MSIPFELILQILRRPELRGCAGLLRCVHSDWNHLVEGTSISVSKIVGNIRVYEWAESAGRRHTLFAEGIVGEYGCIDVIDILVRSDTSPFLIWIGAANKGRIDVFERLGQRHFKESVDYVCKQAARNGHLEALKWLRAHNAEWDSETIINAVEGGHFQVLKWAYDNGCEPGKYMCSTVAKSGNLDMIMWLDSNDRLKREKTCERVAGSGNLDALKWVRKRGYPWGRNTCSRAAERGHLHVLKWARKNDCPWDNNVYGNAASRGHLDVIEWAYANGCPWTIDRVWEVCELAIKGLHFHVLKWVASIGVHIDVEWCISLIKVVGYCNLTIEEHEKKQQDMIAWLKSLAE